MCYLCFRLKVWILLTATDKKHFWISFSPLFLLNIFFQVTEYERYMIKYSLYLLFHFFGKSKQ